MIQVPSQIILKGPAFNPTRFLEHEPWKSKDKRQPF